MTTHFVLGKVITVYCLESSEINTLWWAQGSICDVMQL